MVHGLHLVRIFGKTVQIEIRIEYRENDKLNP